MWWLVGFPKPGYRLWILYQTDYCIVGKFGKLTLFEHVEKKVWQINRSVNRLIIIVTNLNSFSLTNHGQFAKLSHCMVFQSHRLKYHGSYTGVDTSKPCNNNINKSS